MIWYAMETLVAEPRGNLTAALDTKLPKS